MNTIERIQNLSYEEQRAFLDRLYAIAPKKEWTLPERPTCLKAFVKPSGVESVSEKELRYFLNDLLPAHLIPLRYESVESFPITPNGKIDRKALETPAPGSTRRLGENKGLPKPEKTIIEERLLEIWRNVLGLREIDIGDNFFDLGGYSLTAAKLVKAVEIEYGLKFSIADLFKAPTVSEFLKLIEKKPLKKQRRSLVELKDGLSSSGLFCIHGYTGEVYGFLDLAKTFSTSRPVYGLQALGLDGKEPFQTSVEDMAKLYVDEMFEVQADGPYHLLGHSLGGWIAYAVAQEIKRRGKAVGCLGLLDTHVSPAMPWIFKLPETLEHLCERSVHHAKVFKTIPSGERFAYLCDRLKWFRVHFFGAEISEAMRGEFEEKSGKPENYYYFADVGNRYLPEKYDGDVDLFVGEDSKSYHTWFWNYLIKGKLRIHKTPGNHNEIIDGDHAQEFVDLYEKILSSIESRDVEV